MFSYILFDLDGTISDPKPGITKCVQYALHSFGIEEPDPDKLEPFIGPPLVDSFMEFYGMNEEQAWEAVKKYRERFAVRGMFENTLYPGMKEMLERLCGAGCHLAVASSKAERFVKEILDYFGISDCFEVVVGSELDGSRSQKEEVVEEALRRLFLENDIQYDSTVMVGDRKFDVEGAHTKGLRAVGCAFGYAQPGELEASGADYIAQTVEELEKILSGMPGGRE